MLQHILFSQFLMFGIALFSLNSIESAPLKHPKLYSGEYLFYSHFQLLSNHQPIHLNTVSGTPLSYGLTIPGLPPGLGPFSAQFSFIESNKENTISILSQKNGAYITRGFDSIAATEWAIPLEKFISSYYQILAPLHPKNNKTNLHLKTNTLHNNFMSCLSSKNTKMYALYEVRALYKKRSFVMTFKINSEYHATLPANPEFLIHTYVKIIRDVYSKKSCERTPQEEILYKINQNGLRRISKSGIHKKWCHLIKKVVTQHIKRHLVFHKKISTLPAF